MSTSHCGICSAYRSPNGGGGDPTTGIYNPDDPENTPQGTLVAWVRTR